MKPSEFKSRFLELEPDYPPELNILPPQFVTFDAARANALNIAPADRAFLIESGFPEQAAPFLSFGSTFRSLPQVDGQPGIAAFGHNGAGDPIAIDPSQGGAVVTFNHDANMARTFVNTSLAKFAECLCHYAELTTGHQDTGRFLQAVRETDPDAAGNNTMWTIEALIFDSIVPMNQ